MLKESTKSILKLVAENGKNVSARLASQLGITRQASSSKLRDAVSKGFIIKSGVGRGVEYSLAETVRVQQVYERQGLSEDIVWTNFLLPIVSDLSDNVKVIWQYGLTEMVNNAIDHSGSEKITVSVSRNYLYTQVYVVDEGEGIFNKIQKALNLYDPREAILELAKGKFTTDPQNHSGEGIFFSSKVFDIYDIRSGNLHFMHNNGNDYDWLIERQKNSNGTLVYMRLDNDSSTTLKEVFDKFATPEEYTFAKTIVPVRLGQYEGEKLVSRSQAKRLIFRFEKFKTVILDFTGVEEIGQAFSDEVFRVFQNAHPDVKLVPINMTVAVKSMVSRAKAA